MPPVTLLLLLLLYHEQLNFQHASRNKFSPSC
jgi:hypothetical protein